MSDVKVTNISITIGKKELNLTIEDAKKLQDALNEIFGNPTTVIYRDWVKPYITWNDYNTNKITCSSASIGINSLSTLQYKTE